MIPEFYQANDHYICTTHPNRHCSPLVTQNPLAATTIHHTDITHLQKLSLLPTISTIKDTNRRDAIRITAMQCKVEARRRMEAEQRRKI